MNIRVPAKLILTGEHSVIYNQTALTCAINKYLYCMDSKKGRLFLQKHDFIAYCLKAFFSYAGLPEQPVNFSLRSFIPTKSGLGSSAALIVSILLYLHHFFNIPIREAQFLALAQEIENYQHGKSSGIDIKTIYHGDICAFEGTNLSKLSPYEDTLRDIYIINSGKPKFHTKEVVTMVREGFAQDAPLWEEFAQTSKGIMDCIRLGEEENLKDLLKKNQLLLQRIGIVSDKVMNFVKDLKDIGIYAKVCGAGTIGLKDKACGFLGVFHRVEEEHLPAFYQIVKRYHYVLEKVKIEREGARKYAN